MRFILALFSTAVMAFEGVISPLADDAHPVLPTVAQPRMTFGSLLQPAPSPTPVPTLFTPTPTPKPAILGITVSPAPIASPTPTLTHKARKDHFAIALLGDSMTDTLGPEVPHLKQKLQTIFPGTTYTVLNYGVGATNIDAGLERLNQQYVYQDRSMPALITLAPDIVVVESFGYNPYPFDDGAIDRHWMALAKIVDALRARLPETKIIIAATIAPNSQMFATGAPGLNMPPEQKISHTANIKRYLDSTVKFALGQKLPLADAFHASLMKNGDGNLIYINGGDHIHYSEAGRDLMAQKITEAILEYRLLE